LVDDDDDDSFVSIMSCSEVARSATTDMNPMHRPNQNPNLAPVEAGAAAAEGDAPPPFPRDAGSGAIIVEALMIAVFSINSSA
jgi:hypothetical protein